MKNLYSNKMVIFSLILPGILVFLFAILAPICLSVYYGLFRYGDSKIHWDEKLHRPDARQIIWQVITYLIAACNRIYLHPAPDRNRGSSST